MLRNANLSRNGAAGGALRLNVSGPLSGPLRRSRFISCRAWKEVTDPDTGRPYYWNTETNVTTWEKPQELIHAEANVDIASTVGGTTDDAGGASAPSFAEILSQLEETLAADGNMFGAAANSHREHGVFTNDFMDFLEAEMRQCTDAMRRESLARVQARIVNPLLKQGEFY